MPPKRMENHERWGLWEERRYEDPSEDVESEDEVQEFGSED